MFFFLIFTILYFLVLSIFFNLIVNNKYKNMNIKFFFFFFFLILTNLLYLFAIPYYSYLNKKKCYLKHNYIIYLLSQEGFFYYSHFFKAIHSPISLLFAITLLKTTYYSPSGCSLHSYRHHLTLQSYFCYSIRSIQPF